MLLALAVTACASVPLFASRADACGGFFGRTAREGERRPSLAYEQALIVFDAERRREHFVREVVFREALQPFGFVVPTPTRPEVAALKKSPFASLRTDFPFESLDTKGGLRPGSMGGGAGAAHKVQVLEIAKVGSFTAFVLAANDAKALASWLARNGLSSTPQTDAWLAHYVKLKFFYVAMRYDPPSRSGDTLPPDPARTLSEAMRISFDTPLPYYPYFEPEPAPQTGPRPPRLLELWLVAKESFVPVAAQEHGARTRWVRPLAAGRSYGGNNREALERALGSDSKLLPAAVPSGDFPLQVQRFMDQKRSRVGFGDVVFVPAQKIELDAPARTRLAPLLALLDPRLLESTR